VSHCRQCDPQGRACGSVLIVDSLTTECQPMPLTRQDALREFYRQLERLRDRIGGFRYLGLAKPASEWPVRGVYFFFDHQERNAIDGGSRVVRVGTHAVSLGSRSTLWNRLAQHRGSLSGAFAGGGNHRGSVFRLHVGRALIQRYFLHGPGAASWGIGNSATPSTRHDEHRIEVAVSDYIRALPFLAVAVDDRPGRDSLRKVVERQAIALLSEVQEPGFSPPAAWLGCHSDQVAIRRSGLWNVRHVEEPYSHEFPDVFAELVQRMLGPTT
jgi:hypothetical protein